MKIRIVLAVLILSILAGSATAESRQRKQIRNRKKLQLKAENECQKADHIRLRKRLRTISEEDAQINALIKMFMGDQETQQTRTRTRKKVCDQIYEPTCQQDGEMKQDRDRLQKQDGSCDEDAIIKMFLGGVLKGNGDGTGDGEPDQDRTRTRERKKICEHPGEPNCLQAGVMKQDRTRDQKQDGSCGEDVLKGNGDGTGDGEPGQDRTRTRDRKKTCLQDGDPNCVQNGEMKQDRTREQKQDGTCGDVLKGNGDGTGDGEPDQDRTRTRDRKKICDPNCIQAGEMKQDRTRDQKQDGSCAEDVLKGNGDGTGDGEPDQDRTRTRDRKKVSEQTCPECQGECEKECENLRIRKRDRVKG